jgi:hypothetical protein
VGSDDASGTTWTLRRSAFVWRARSSAVCRDGVTMASALRTARDSPARYMSRHCRGKYFGCTRNAMSCTVTTRRCPGPAGGTAAGTGECTTSQAATDGGSPGRLTSAHPG